MSRLATRLRPVVIALHRTSCKPLRQPAWGAFAAANSRIPTTTHPVCVRAFHANPAFWHYKNVDLSEENCIFWDELIPGIEHDKIILVDVRRQDEVDRGRVPAKRYLHISIDELEDALTNLSDAEFKEKYGANRPPKDEEDIVFFCRLGVRSSRAVRIAKEAGYKSPRHYPGGWAVWNERIHTG